MSRVWKVTLLIAVLLLLIMGMSQAWGEPRQTQEAPKFVLKGEKAPVFSAKDHELISAYYEHLTGTQAPGSIDRTPFSPAVEKSLVVGSRVPPQLEKELEPLPDKLEAQLSQLAGDYRRFQLHHHVLIVRKSDLAIADILKDVGLK